MVNTIIISILIILFSFKAFSSELLITEFDLPRLVKENNSIVHAKAMETRGYTEMTGHLARSFIPKISLHAGQESFKYVANEFRRQPYYGAQAELNIYNGSRDQYKSKINHAELEKSQSQQKVVLFSQLEEARKTFWNAIYLKAIISKYSKALALVKKNKKAALKRIRGGVATQSDKYEFDIKETELKQDQKKVQLDLEKQMGLLKVLIGIKQSRPIALNQQLSHDHNWRRLLKHSEDDHNYLTKPQELSVVQMELNSKIASNSWLPKVDAYALWLQRNQRNDFDRAEESDRQQTAFGIKASWEISQLSSGQAKKKAARAKTEAQRMKLNFKRRELENELHMELKELELLDSMVHDAEENIRRSKKFFKLVSNEYKRGVKTSGDMLIATEKLVSSEIRKMSIIKDFHFAKAHIMTKLGE